MQVKASAPGSLMLLGEYAVLYGKRAIVCAVDKRITVTLTPRTDKLIEICSPTQGEYVTELHHIKIEKPFQYVLTALQLYENILKEGCNIYIESEFSDQIGLGSSAAVTIAVLAALVSWLNLHISPLDLVRQGRNVVRSVQNLGSGADVAASVFGGVVAYQTQPLFAEKFNTTQPLTALYSGYKTPTVDAVKRVQAYFSAHPNLFRTITNTIGQCAIEGIEQIRKENWTKFGEMMNIQQGLMESLGVSDLLLRDLVEDLRKQKDIYGAKISGAGLGDCVIGLGHQLSNYQYKDTSAQVQLMPVQMTLQGVHCEKI